MQQFIQCAFTRLIEGGCRLVEENPVGSDEQYACKRKALLLAKREDAAPIVHVVEACGEMIHPYAF